MKTTKQRTIKFIEVKDKTDNSCQECIFTYTCIGGCRAKQGYHWEEI